MKFSFTSSKPLKISKYSHVWLKIAQGGNLNACGTKPHFSGNLDSFLKGGCPYFHGLAKFYLL